MMKTRQRPATEIKTGDCVMLDDEQWTVYEVTLAMLETRMKLRNRFAKRAIAFPYGQKVSVVLDR